MNLHLDWCSHSASLYAVKHWHYSKTLPVPPLLKIGVWENDIFIGAIIFSRGASSNLTKPYGLTQYEACELTRVALNKHTAPVSQMVAHALRMLKSKEGMKLVISFADPKENHHGGIYQAGNWIYSGQSNKSKEYLYRGKKYHSRQISVKGYNIQMGQKRSCPTPSMCEVVDVPGKHRYLMPLDGDTRKQVELLSKPYPKRPGSVDSCTASFQDERGGAEPTPGLNYGC